MGQTFLVIHCKSCSKYKYLSDAFVFLRPSLQLNIDDGSPVPGTSQGSEQRVPDGGDTAEVVDPKKKLFPLMRKGSSKPRSKPIQGKVSTDFTKVCPSDVMDAVIGNKNNGVGAGCVKSQYFISPNKSNIYSDSLESGPSYYDLGFF